MAFCLCQKFNIKKDGNIVVHLYQKLGFEFSWKYLSTTKLDGKLYSLYQFDMSDVTDGIVFETVQLKTEKSSITVYPGKLFTVNMLDSDPKSVTLKVLWSFKNGTTEPIFGKSLGGSSYLCQRLKIQKNGCLFVELKDGLGFAFSWTKEGNVKCKGTRYYQLYHLKISKMNNGLQFDGDLELKYQNKTCSMYPGKNVTVEIFEDEPKWIELNVFWSVAEQENTKMAKIMNFEDINLSAKDFSTVAAPPVPSILAAKLDSPIATKGADFNKEMERLRRLLCNEFETHSGLKTVERLPKKSYSPTTAVSFPPVSEQLKNCTVKTVIPELQEEIEDQPEANSPFSTLTDTFTSKKYSDVVFLTNDSKKVFAHRCILYSFSDIFTALFDQSSDAQIEIEADYPEEIVTRAVEFCYGKNDGIENFEDGLIKFADSYGIKGLKEACLKSLNSQKLDAENVCEIVKIAFEQDYALLKQKCLKFIAKNKATLGAEKLAKLPSDILVSAFLFV